MDSFWSNVIKSTGSVGVVAFLIYFILEHVFSEKIIGLFGRDKLFELTILIIAALLIVFLVAILKSKETLEHNSQSEESKETVECKSRSVGPKVTYKDNSTHNGDNHF